MARCDRYPSISPVACKCLRTDCRHIWVDGTLLNVKLERAAADVRSITCPKCGAKADEIGFACDPASIQEALSA